MAHQDEGPHMRGQRTAEKALETQRFLFSFVRRVSYAILLFLVKHSASSCHKVRQLHSPSLSSRGDAQVPVRREGRRGARIPEASSFSTSCASDEVPAL